MHLTALDYLVLLGYFALMILIGYLSSLRIRHQEDFFMGGRGFGKLLQTFAAFGAGTGSSDPVNTARTTFTSGMSGMWSVMFWLFVTPFYWITGVWYRRMRHLTLGDWFVERYESRAMGTGYCIFGLLFFMVYGSMLFSAIGKVAAPLIGVETFSIGGSRLGIEYLLVPIVGVVVLIYGIAGGLRAAYFTDLVQGLCIIALSVMLIPYGLERLVEEFGSPADKEQGLMAGFRLVHERLPIEKFNIVGSGSASEFPLHRIVAVVIINLVGIVVQPHFIATGGGSAKSEMDARVGLVVGNFLKRFCTIGWVLTALIALALFADNRELIQDPDKTWGLASRELLGPGLTGLMLACLLAALMSSVDAYMIVGSALVVRNIYAPYINPHATEREYVRVGRLTGVLVVLGAVLISLFIMDVFAQLQLTWVFPVLFAAPFWIGMYWRRATTAAAWLTVTYCALMFFLIPWSLPRIWDELRTDPEYTITNRIETTYTARKASPADAKRREEEIRIWNDQYESVRAAIGELRKNGEGGDLLEAEMLWSSETFQAIDRSEIELSPERLEALLAALEAVPETSKLSGYSGALDRLAVAMGGLRALGSRPKPIAAGDVIQDRSTTGGRFIYWDSGRTPATRRTLKRELRSGDHVLVLVEESQNAALYNLAADPGRGTNIAGRSAERTAELRARMDGGPGALDQIGEVLVLTEAYVGDAEGFGNFNLDYLLYRWLGVDLMALNNATLDTLGLPPKIITPFLVMILVSLVTRRNSKEALDRYYAKMKTPVVPDPELDHQNLEHAYRSIAELEKTKLFPGSSFEFQKPTATDVVGVIVCFLACFGIVGLAVWVAGIGGSS